MENRRGEEGVDVSVILFYYQQFKDCLDERGVKGVVDVVGVLRCCEGGVGEWPIRLSTESI
jgi:hypothetical protein